MTTESPVILSAVRTPIGKFQGGLAGFSAPELGGKVVAEAIRRAGLDAHQIDEAILGNVVQAGMGYRIGDGKRVDSMIADGLWDACENFHMGVTGELVAEKYGITREEQDRFAFESHQKAVHARKSCFFEAQILPIEVPQKKGEPFVIKYDESPREDTSMEALGKLKPAFKRDGTVTAGNAPGTNDGAAALIVTSDR